MTDDGPLLVIFATALKIDSITWYQLKPMFPRWALSNALTPSSSNANWGRKQELEDAEEAAKNW